MLLGGASLRFRPRAPSRKNGLSSQTGGLFCTALRKNQVGYPGPDFQQQQISVEPKNGSRGELTGGKEGWRCSPRG